MNLTPTHVCVAAIFERAIKTMALKCLNATKEVVSNSRESKEEEKN